MQDSFNVLLLQVSVEQRLASWELEQCRFYGDAFFTGAPAPIAHEHLKEAQTQSAQISHSSREPNLVCHLVFISLGPRNEHSEEQGLQNTLMNPPK